MARTVRFRTLKMRPKIVTSFRPHGKWGDFLAAIIPGLWCLNILTNSNFILRLIEWQNESSIFLVRIRARQWYWVYKFEMKNLIDILSVPKNIGRNKWFFSNFGDIQYSENYFNVLRMRSKIIKSEEHWEKIFNSVDKNNQELVTGFTEDLSSFCPDSENIDFSFPRYDANRKNFYGQSLLQHQNGWKNILKNVSSDHILYTSLNSQKHNVIYDSNDFYQGFSGTVIDSFLKNFNEIKESFHYADADVQSRTLRRSFGQNQPLKIMKPTLMAFDSENNVKESNSLQLFKIIFNEGDSVYHDKNANDIFFFTIKQLKYKRRTSIPVYSKLKINNETQQKELIFKGRTILLNNNVFAEYLKNPDSLYKIVQKNKNTSENMSVSLSRRLLRTRRTLVLPAHMNITLITNSFDVVHSWFVPGLGLKLDCVPGRSTHHTLYIDNVGFYYGQCAEICGRYHHHMPIRICALPFEHFLMWWNVFGLPKIIFQKRFNSYLSTYACRKFLW